MNAIIKSNRLARQWTTIRIALSIIFGRFGEKMENIGHLFFHMTVYGRRAGYVEFGLEDESADGFLRFRVTDEDQKVRLLVINFRISNRWLIRRGQRPSPKLLCNIKNDAEVREGLKVHSIVWGGQGWNNKEVSPFDISRLPSAEIIAARHAGMKKVQDFLAKYFPAREYPSGMTIEDAAMDIIKRY